MTKLKHLVESTHIQKQAISQWAGMTPSQFSKIINGKRKLDPESMLGLRTVLLEKGVPQKELDEALYEINLLAENIC